MLWLKDTFHWHGDKDFVLTFPEYVAVFWLALNKFYTLLLHYSWIFSFLIAVPLRSAHLEPVCSKSQDLSFGFHLLRFASSSSLSGAMNVASSEENLQLKFNACLWRHLSQTNLGSSSFSNVEKDLIQVLISLEVAPNNCHLWVC